MSWTSEDFAEAIGSFRREVAGVIRRMTIGRSDGGIWQTVGHILLDGTTKEAREVENYPGIGIFSRPPDGGSGESIVVHAGGPNNPAIVGSRDEATRANVDDIAADESTLYNSKSRVYIKADGSVEIRSHGGAAVSLATKADVRALADFVGTLFVGGSGSAVIPPHSVPLPTGTQKLKGE